MSEVPDRADPSAAADPTLEERLRRLEEIVEALDADDLELDRALALFEEGVGHIRRTEALLAEVELRVEELIGEGEAAETRRWREGSNDAGEGGGPE